MHRYETLVIDELEVVALIGILPSERVSQRRNRRKG